MTLTKLLILVTAIAVILSALNIFVWRKNRNSIVTFLQNFAGVLFVISGLVKAIDPLGTAYKMVDYFAEFESTFSNTWFSFISGVFPLLSEMSVGFSVFMIVLEIILGIMLVLGYKNRISAILFFVIVLFFTFLTGFTYLTGYVPSEVNFFEFNKWGPYVKSNMKVNDCGCFGDFLKLEPKVSFLKDLVLFIPALVFLFFTKKMFSLTSQVRRFSITAVVLILSLFFCFRNYVWNLPIVDFRPFYEGVNILEERKKESEAQANAPVTYVLLDRETQEKLHIPNDELMKNYEKYPKSKYEYLDPIYGEPSIPITKISEFSVQDLEGNEITDEILNHKGPSLMIVNYKLKGTEKTKKGIKRDTIFQIDTMNQEGAAPVTIKRIVGVVEVVIDITQYEWEKNYQLPFINKVVPFGNEALKDGIKVYSITKLYDPEKIESFRKSIQAEFPIYMADDILLKTIIRSNPGVIYLENDRIMNKWHHKKLPTYQEFIEKYQLK